jgi:hypothetical protein
MPSLCCKYNILLCFSVLFYFQVLIEIKFKTPELDLKIHQGRFGHFQSSKLLLPSEELAKTNQSIDFIIDQSNH